MSKKSDSQDIASTLYGSAQTTNYLTNFDRFAHHRASDVGVTAMAIRLTPARRSASSTATT